MSSTTWELFRLQIDERVDLFKNTNPTKLILNILKYLIIIGVATGLLIFVFLRFQTIGLVINSNVFAFLLLVTQVLSFAIALASIFKALYFSKDNDLLMSMPCSNNQVFISKLMVLYAYELIANTIYTLPILIAYGITANVAVSPAFYACIPIFLLILPLLALVSAAIVSLPVMAVVKRIRKNAALSVIAILIIAAAFLTVYMLFATSVASSIDFNAQQSSILISVNTLLADIARYTWYFDFIGKGMLFMGSWWWSWLFSFGFTAVCLTIAYAAIKPLYFRLSSQGLETTSKDREHKKGYSLSSPFASILKKEFLTMFRSPSSVFSYTIFAILMPFIVVLYDILLFSLNVTTAGINMIVASHLLVILILCTMSNLMSATAISRDGGNFYLTKISPVSIKSQAWAKIIFNLIITYTGLILTYIATSIFIDINPLVNFLCILFALIFTFGHVIISVMLDLRKPVLDWYDASEIEKISKSPKQSIWLGLILTVILFAVLFTCAFFPSLNSIIPWTVAGAAVVIFSITALVLFEKKVDKLYERMEC